MLTPEEDVEITSLKKKGWSISAIARHTGRDRKTVRAYLGGEREPGVRKRAEPDGFDRFEPYVRQRLADDPHVRATVLFAEVAGLGFDRSYQTFTRQLRDRQLRPHCEPCASSNGRAHVDIEHPPGEEIQWDWLELVDTPWGDKAFVLVGALSCSGQFRGWFSDSDDEAHLVVGVDEVLRRIGGTPKRWRVDRMATVINPTTGTIQRSFDAGRQALRRRGRPVSASARESQGRGREGDRLPDPVVVADRPYHLAGGGSGIAGCVVCGHRGCPPPGRVDGR